MHSFWTVADTCHDARRVTAAALCSFMQSVLTVMPLFLGAKPIEDLLAGIAIVVRAC